MTTDKILEQLSQVHFQGFFITVDFVKASNTVPGGIEEFLNEKYQAILQGITGRKFAYQASGWRMLFTFYPTDRVVEEKYAMKNKIYK